MVVDRISICVHGKCMGILTESYEDCMGSVCELYAQHINIDEDWMRSVWEYMEIELYGYCMGSVWICVGSV